MNAKKNADAKGITNTSELVLFLLGLFIVIVLLFSLLFFFFRNQDERVAEQNAANLVRKIDAVCTYSEPQTLQFNLPQKLGFEDSIRNLLHISPNVGTDPYFYVYYEKFPPDPPANLWAEITGNQAPSIGTLQMIIAPWSEDYPWSQNLMLTAAIDIATMDLNLGFGKLEQGGQQLNGIANAEISSSDTLSKAIEAKQIIVNAKGIFIGDLPNFAKNTAAATVACMALTQKSLTDCALFSAVAVAGTHAAGVGLKQAWNTWNFGVVNEENVVMQTNGLKKILDEGAVQGDGAVIDSLREQGFLIERGNDFVVNDPDTIAAIQLYCKENPVQCAGDWLGDLHIIRTKTGNIGDIILDKTKMKGFVYSVNQFWDGVQKSIGSIMYQDVGSSKFSSAIADTLESQDVQTKRAVLDQLMRGGYNVGDVVLANDNSVEAAIARYANGLRNAGADGDILLVEKGTGLADVFSRIDNGNSASAEMNIYIASLANKKFTDQSQELKNFYGLLTQKPFKLSDQINEFTKGTLGYSFLRIQDQTPLGATYWNQQVSVYNYPASPCQPGQICLQYGIYVQKYNLPDSCTLAGVTNIKLKRNSVVAPDPRFYLVSPCFSKVEITKENDTIFINPKICNTPPSPYNGLPNYCYATSGVVNYYVGSESASFFADCITNVICNAATGTLGGNLGSSAVLACLNMKTPAKYASLCGALGQGARLVLDASRETVVNYPYVPKTVQGSLGLDNRYVDC